MIRFASILALTASVIARPASALDVGSEDGVLSVEVHGFVSQTFIVTTDHEYLTADTTRGSFKFSEAGINFTKRLSDQVQLGAQLFAHYRGLRDNYNARFDWFYVDYHADDWLGIRFGRLKIPFGLYNEYNDVDAGRVPVLLPQSVYPLQTRDFLFAQTGGEAYGFGRLGGLGALEYRIFFGAIFVDADMLTPLDGSVQVEFEVPYVLGARVFWETPLENLRLGASIESLRLDTTAIVQRALTVELVNRSLLWVLSLEYSYRDLLFSAEYSRWRATQNSSLASSSFANTSERSYAMLQYRVADWVQAGAYYALFFPNADQREGLQNQQHDVALTLRFDINEYWLFKLEGHYMAGTAGLVNPLRINPATDENAEANWGVLLVRTTAYF